MASTSASSIQKSFKYDVFLSFRGEDTRKTFVDHLYHALVNRGIITYKDDVKIEKGERITEQLSRSIEDSRYYIIVFSMDYASSSWCLEELVKIMECQRAIEHTAYPIFYDVEPTEVRNQSGPVGKAFAKHVNEEGAGRWRNALKEAAGLAGWELKTTFDGHESKFIQNLVKDISVKLHFIKSNVDENLVGMETRVEKVVSSLEIGANDVRIAGIKGMGGGGKTTLAQAVFYHASILFEGKSFVENVREVSKGSLSGLKDLQKHVLKDVLNDQSIDVTSVFDGKNKMKNMMPGTKVLLVLDDVDDIDQLDALAGSLSWFKPGSRIIITTRNEQVLVARRVKFIHDINLLSYEEAIRLFSRYAFGRELPIEGYEELSRKVVNYADGLPLTIKVLGSDLCGRTAPEWVDILERLKTIPLEKTLKKLQISYDALEKDQQEIFLDVACILKGESKDKAITILESCGFHARAGLRVLEQKSLIRISIKDGLRFHDHIEEMGRNIVRGLHPDEPSRHTRLWLKEEIEDILDNDLGTKETQCIKLENSELHPATIMKGLRKMDLRFLYVDGEYHVGEIVEAGEYLYLPDTLRSLHWPGYPFWCLPKTFKAYLLVYLEMPRSNISKLWEGEERKALKKIRFVDLKFSKLRTFDLGLTPHLERLDLEGCNDFVELQMPIKCPSLKFLNLSGSKVSNLNLGQTPYLEWLDLNQCYYLQEIHAPGGCLEKLVFLNLSGCLRFDNFQFNKRYELPVGDSLVKLHLSGKSLHICPLHPNNNLPKLQFKCFYDEPLSSSSGNIEKLISFGLCACTNLEGFSVSISGLRCLGVLTLEGNIPEVPQDLYKLKSLVELSLSIKEIKNIPYSICIMEHLKSLKLKSCWLLEQLPEDLGRLQCLQELHLTDCISLRGIPNSICKMTCLEYLHLPYCSLIEKLPKELGHLRSLKELNIEGTGISCLPESISQMKGLCIVWSRVLLELHGFTSLRNISRYTASCYV